MFANYPLAVQILGWGVFMGLNGYIGATCPGLNLAVLAFMGMFANRKVGIVLLVVAIIITLAESFWFILNVFAAGMSTIPQKALAFVAQGTGILNLIVAGIVFFILMGPFTNSFSTPKWLLVAVASLFYIAGAWAGVCYWIPVVSHCVLLVAIGLLVALCYTVSVPFAIGISALLFLVLAAVWGTGIFQWNQKRIEAFHLKNTNEIFLQAAANNQQEQMVQLWASVNEYTKEQALLNALNAQNADLVKFLVKQGAQTQEIMRHAIYDKNLDTIKMLVEAETPIEPYYVEDAADYNFLPGLQFLVEKGVDINQKNYRPLTKAVAEAHTEIAEYLLKTGKNSQETLNEALTTLCDSYNYRGTETDKENLAKLLLEYGAQANNHAGNFNTTPLHGASYYGPLALVKLLVEKGADVNASDDDGRTVLMKAVEQDDLEIAEFLLQQGANRTINSLYNSPNSSPTEYTALFRAKSPKMAELLLANGAKTSYIDSLGRTVLLNAVDQRNAELVKVFLDHGVNINARDKEGQTALANAVEDTSYARSQIETVKLLLAHGADVNIADKEGKSPLMLAQENNNTEIIELLKSAGAKE